MIYDVGIIGLGIAGSIAALKLSEKNKDIKIIGIEFGRPPMKRRHQIIGWLGSFPNSDGKVFISDIDKVSNLVVKKKTKKAAKYVKEIFSQFSDCKIIKDTGPSTNVKKKLKKNDFDIISNSYFQLYPKDIHSLSKYIIEKIELNPNITLSFDNEVHSIIKQKKIFHIQTDDGEIKCKKVIFCVGRAGWRFAHKIFSNFGLIDNNDFTKFGIRIEMADDILKDFNESTCTLTKNDLEIGPFCWNGTIQPEDHFDMAISAFRSNENRWKTNKVSFQFIKNVFTKDIGVEETNRLASLTYLLSNDRIAKEKVSSIVNGRSKILMIPEYKCLINSIKEFATVVPEILTKAYFHTPAIIPTPSQIKIGTNLSTELDGFYVAGEATGIVGIYAAAITGAIAADAVCRG